MITYVTELTSDNFSESIKSKSVVLVDIWATWCGPCKMLSPIIDEVGAHFGESVLVGKLDADANVDVVKELGVRNIPTVLIYKNGEVVDRFVGVKNKNEITTLVEKHID
jgi:thioredoxin 1